ncbi:unnamed protein product [Boreogadus saida]
MIVSKLINCSNDALMYTTPVVCQACSNNKFYLEYLKNQPARVCDHRFTKLQENRKRGGIFGDAQLCKNN